MEKTKIHRVAVVGCGALAQAAHLPNIQRNPRFELVLTCDREEKVAEMCRAQFGAQRAETDWRKVVTDPEVDLIVLATHVNLRGELIIPALKNGKPVYTEKPLSPDDREMREIVKTTRETGIPVCVGHNRRSSPAMLEFRRLLEKARSGVSPTRPSVDRDLNRKITIDHKEARTQILMRINDDDRSWKDWGFRDAQGTMFAEMVHFIDLALWFNEGSPVRLFAEGAPHGNFTLVLKFSDGSITTMQHTRIGNFDYPKELFEATTRYITVALDQHIEVRQVGMADEPVLQTFPYAEDCGWAKQEGMTGYFLSLIEERKQALSENRPLRFLNVKKGHYQHLDRFLDCLEGKCPNPCDAESAVPVNRLAMKFLESAASGLPINLGPEIMEV
ncbi:MAG: Gfo/Idh/MocA family oxidoreductase [Candidatus Omnitrophica bacterium]|nr:Gfo/Idh/MocA family oxidoreductase [Candidatus Omnitrophota bacterium]